jgi:hypothetical protein
VEDVEKYFAIHVTYGNKDSDGYTIPVIANNEENATQKAISKKLFEYEEDVNCIDYIEELKEEEYGFMT